ncbi:unnamed protein product [Polarella glacialis]|uniref:Uncharacterized protein n=1 Tax=Polarella glacialis TaxID=89957 RepID=A0A813HA23_POLGL|nr:unnamed protein product [Polarella glacialis]
MGSLDFDIDLLSQPSTAEVLMGARARGAQASRDPREIICDDLHFDNFDPDAPSVSSSSSAKPPQSTSFDGPAKAIAIDPEELKRRIHGPVSGPDRLRQQAVAGGLRVSSLCLTQMREKPRVAFGTLVVILLMFMSGTVWNLIFPGSADVVQLTQSKALRSPPDQVRVTESAEPDSPDDQDEPAAAGVQVGSGATLGLSEMRKDHKGLREDVASLRREVAELKTMLKQSVGSGTAAAVPKKMEGGDVQQEAEVELEDLASTHDAELAAMEQQDAGAEQGDAGEVQAEKPRAPVKAPATSRRRQAKAAAASTAPSPPAAAAGESRTIGDIFAR